MNKFFEYNNRYGSWTINNFLVFQFLAYIVYLLIAIIHHYQLAIYREKFWNTLPLLVIGPFSRFNILSSILLTRMIIILIPFITILIICCIISPISIFTLIVISGIFLLIALIFSGLGLILGIFIISKENLFKIFDLSIAFIFIFSCLTYPFEIFPQSIQFLIILNPFYYLFDILRLIWIENNIIISITSHPYHFVVLLVSSIFFPFIGIFIFNFLFKKYGIVGY